MGWGRGYLLSVLVGGVAGCSPSGPDEPDPTPYNPAFVHVTSPTTGTSHVAACGEITLSGDASISETGWGCCAGTAAEMTGVTVGWHNAATGQLGVAHQTVHICSFLSAMWPCQPHGWSATVPLVTGTNALTVTATDVAGYTATATLDVWLAAPTFEVSGGVHTQGGAPLWDAGSGGVRLALDDGQGRTATAFSYADGGFRFGCVAPGAYTLTPSDSIAFPFTPPSRAVTVVEADLTGQDFSAAAHAVTGHVEGQFSGFAGARLELTGAGGSTWARADGGGDYRLLAPDGAWTLTAEACDLTGCHPVIPDHIDVTVAGADVPGQDFLVQFWP
jgi:hypothetical protein